MGLSDASVYINKIRRNLFSCYNDFPNLWACLFRKFVKKLKMRRSGGREGGNNSCFSFYFIGQWQQKTNRRWMFKQLLYQILKDKTDVKRTNMRSLSPNTRGMLPHHTIWLGQRLSPLTSLFPFSTLLRIKSCIHVNLVAFYHTPTHNN